MLEIISPFTCISRSVSTGENSLTIKFPTFEVALVYISIGADHPSSSVGLIISPKPLVKCEIFPNLLTFTISHSMAKLSNIPGTLFHLNGSFSDKRRNLFITILKGSYPLSDCSGSLVIEIFRFKSISICDSYLLVLLNILASLALTHQLINKIL